MRGRMVVVLVGLTTACASARARSPQRLLTEAEWDKTATCLTYQAHARGYDFYITSTQIVVHARSQGVPRSTLNNAEPSWRYGIGPREGQVKPALVPNTRRREEVIFEYRSTPGGIVTASMAQALEGSEHQWSKAPPSLAMIRAHRLLETVCFAGIGRPAPSRGDRITD